jgi:hypothetical protein
VPALDSRFGVDEVVLLVSGQMRNQARWLKRVFKRHGLACTAWPAEAHPFDPRKMEEVFLDLLAELPTDRPLLLNATGGTKIMALTAANVFAQFNRGEIIYVDTARKRIIFLHPDRSRVCDLRPVLNVSDYLTSYGMLPKKPVSRWQRGDTIPQFSPAARCLAKQAPDLDLFFGALNQAGRQVLDSSRAGEKWPRSAMMRSRPFPAAGKFAPVLEILTRENRVMVSGNLVTFPDENAARFLSGGWLEEYTFTAACRAGADEVVLSQSVEWESTGKREVRNEFDCLALKDNRLFLIECKTMNLDEEKGSDILYKLDSLTDSAVGVYGRGALVSARRPTAFMTSRAKAQRHKIFIPEDLGNLEVELAQWFD